MTYFDTGGPLGEFMKRVKDTYPPKDKQFVGKVRVPDMSDYPAVTVEYADELRPIGHVSTRQEWEEFSYDSESQRKTSVGIVVEKSSSRVKISIAPSNVYPGGEHYHYTESIILHPDQAIEFFKNAITLAEQLKVAG